MPPKAAALVRRRRGRIVEPAARADIEQLLAARPRRRDLLLEYLHAIQDAHGCLRAAHLAALADWLRLSVAEVYEVASFYHHFDLVGDGEDPPPELTVRVCDSIACALAGAEELLADLTQQLPDARLQRVPCVGRCAEAPVAVVRRFPVEHATPDTVCAAVADGRFEDSVPPCPTHAQAREQGAYAQLERLLRGELDAEQVLAELERADLRGLGGAGFPAARKWRIVRGHPKPRMLAVNIDEGEPGTFKDRHYLEHDLHALFEGMLIATQLIEAERIFLYIRDEYAGARAMLDAALRDLHAHPPCPLPAIELRRGAGAYVCGEESAMLESLEGRRGMPRLRPPYIAECGLFGRPTLEHNIETLCWVPKILARGSAWYRGHGRRGRCGLRSFSLSGRIRNPGVYPAPAGITVRELIDECGGGMLPGHAFYGYFPGGASGGLLPAELGDLPLDFGTLEEYGCFLGSGAVIVLSEQDRARDAALNAMRFFAHESCGKCTPCRVGTVKAADLMQAPHWDAALLDELSAAMRDASICGLGQAAPNPMQAVLRYFPHEVQA